MNNTFFNIMMIQQAAPNGALGYFLCVSYYKQGIPPGF